MSKNHGVGLSKKNKFTVDPTKKPASINTITLFPEDTASLTKAPLAFLSSSSHIWDQPPAANVSIVGSTIVIKAFCLLRKKKKTTYGGDGDDDLTITLVYDDGSGGNPTDVDECTFTDVEYTG